MQYKVIFANENNDTMYFEHSAKELSPTKIDLDSFSYGYDGVTIHVPESNIFKVLLEETDDVLVKNLLWEEIVIYLQGYASRSVGDYVWVGDELVRLLTFNAIDNSWTCERGANGTRRYSHILNIFDEEAQQVFINGRHSPVGMECTVYDYNDTPVFLGYVSEVHTNGAGLDLELKNVLDKLEGETIVDHEWMYLGTFLVRYTGFTDKILDLSLIPLDARETLIVTSEIDKSSSLFSASGTDILSAMLKISFSYLTLKDGTFRVVPIEHPNTFNPINPRSLDNITRFDGGYEAKLTTNGKGCKVTYNYELSSEITSNDVESYSTRELYVNPSSLVSAYKSDFFEFDLSAVSYRTFDPDANREWAMRVGKKAVQMFGLIFGELEVDVISGSVVEVGDFYELPSNRVFSNFVPPNLDAVLLCIGYSDMRASFVVLERSEYNPVAPAIVVQADASDQLSFDYYNAGDFLITNLSNIEFANHPTLGVTYFEVNDVIALYDLLGNLVGNYTITNITSNVITIDVALTTTEELIMTYPSIASGKTNTKQEQFLYNDRGIV